MRKFLAPLALAAVVTLVPASAQASTSPWTPGPIHCNTMRCVQYRTRELFQGHQVETITSKRVAPLESRSLDKVIHWSPWHFVSLAPGQPQS